MIDEFIEKLNALGWEYHMESKPTHPLPDNELPTVTIIKGDEFMKVLYVDEENEYEWKIRIG